MRYVLLPFFCWPFLLLPFFCWPFLSLFAQPQASTIHIVDIDGSPIPYVNVYALRANAGAVGTLDGSVELPEILLTAKHATTELRISAIGYRDTSLSVRAARSAPQLVLAKATYELAEAEVVDAYTWGKAQRLGERAKKTFLCYAVHQMGELGTENAVVVESDRRCRIDKVYVQSNHLTADEATLEVNFYTIDTEGLPDEPIQRSPIVWPITRREARRTLALDVQEQGVRTEGDFAVSIELVDVSEPGEGLFVNMPCNPTAYPGRTKSTDGSWSKYKDEWGLSIGAVYVEARCAQ